ncbi:hypothetical protein ACPFMY_000422 [Vibrio cholerae]
MKFDIKKLKSAIAEMNINAAVDSERFESKEAYFEWLKDYIEYEIVQPLEREAAEAAGVDEYSCDDCENNEEARDVVIDLFSKVESDLFSSFKGKNAAYKEWLHKLNRSDQLPRGKFFKSKKAAKPIMVIDEFSCLIKIMKH